MLLNRRPNIWKTPARPPSQEKKFHILYKSGLEIRTILRPVSYQDLSGFSGLGKQPVKLDFEC